MRHYTILMHTALQKWKAAIESPDQNRIDWCDAHVGETLCHMRGALLTVFYNHCRRNVGKCKNAIEKLMVCQSAISEALHLLAKCNLRNRRAAEGDIQFTAEMTYGEFVKANNLMVIPDDDPHHMASGDYTWMMLLHAVVASYILFQYAGREEAGLVETLDWELIRKHARCHPELKGPGLPVCGYQDIQDWLAALTSCYVRGCSTHIGLSHIHGMPFEALGRRVMRFPIVYAQYSAICAVMPQWLRDGLSLILTIHRYCGDHKHVVAMLYVPSECGYSLCTDIDSAKLEEIGAAMQLDCDSRGLQSDIEYEGMDGLCKEHHGNTDNMNALPVACNICPAFQQWFTSHNVATLDVVSSLRLYAAQHPQWACKLQDEELQTALKSEIEQSHVLGVSFQHRHLFMLQHAYPIVAMQSYSRLLETAALIRSQEGHAN